MQLHSRVVQSPVRRSRKLLERGLLEASSGSVLGWESSFLVLEYRMKVIRRGLGDGLHFMSLSNYCC